MSTSEFNIRLFFLTVGVDVLNDLSFWLISGGLALLDTGVVIVLYGKVIAIQFRRLPWAVLITTFIFWAALWTSVLWLAWDWFYGFIFPTWLRAAAPLLGLVYAPIGLLMWGIAARTRMPVVTFCLLGGVEGILSHTWAIFGLDLIHKIPLMGNSTPLSVLFFAFFEKVLYWSFILWAGSIISEKLRKSGFIKRKLA